MMVSNMPAFSNSEFKRYSFLVSQECHAESRTMQNVLRVGYSECYYQKKSSKNRITKMNEILACLFSRDYGTKRKMISKYTNQIHTHLFNPARS